MITPCGERLLIEPIVPPEVSESGLTLRTPGHRPEITTGTVVAVGPGRQLDDGSRLPIGLHAGDVVYFYPYGQPEILDDGKSYYIIDEFEVQAIIT